MISKDEIVRLRMRLIQIKTREAVGIRNIDDIIKFFETFSGNVGELLAMADAFRKISESVAVLGTVVPDVVMSHILEFKELEAQKNSTCSG